MQICNETGVFESNVSDAINAAADQIGQYLQKKDVFDLEPITGVKSDGSIFGEISFDITDENSKDTKIRTMVEFDCKNDVQELIKATRETIDGIRGGNDHNIEVQNDEAKPFRGPNESDKLDMAAVREKAAAVLEILLKQLEQIATEE